MQPDLTVSRTYSGPICLQDPLDKELMTESSLFNPLSDIKVKVQSSFMVSLGVSERAEYHGKNHSGTFPHGNNHSFSTIHPRNKTPYIQNLSSLPTRTELRTTGVFGHLGGRLVMPNTGKCAFVCFLTFIWTLLYLYNEISSDSFFKMCIISLSELQTPWVHRSTWFTQQTRTNYEIRFFSLHLNVGQTDHLMSY